MIKIGITGGIASGKSIAASYCKTKGAYIFNADQRSKKHLKKSLSLQKKIINVFGKKIAPNNKINLDLLAKEAFSNKINIEILNGIMWPEVFLLINREYDKIKNKKQYNSFIVDAALIFEANYNNFFDSTILITASKKIRVERAIKRKNISLENIQNRISFQMKDTEKSKLADYIIKNEYSTKNLYNKLDKVINQITLIK
tara:strand:- start:50 stop:649 length:600 start_codon:yes stop_codon:yes gene_type:complete